MQRLAVTTAAFAFFVIFAGSMVTSTHSGMAVPDWPLSFGRLMPPMVGGVFYEHGHRMVAGLAGLLTFTLALAAQFSRETRAVKRLCWIACAVWVSQALLGGLTVLIGTHYHWEHTSPVVSPIHASLAQLFFCLLLSVAVLTGRVWKSKPAVPMAADSRVTLAKATVAAVYFQILMGAVIRHQGIGMIIPDFPLSYGKVIPEFYDLRVAIAFAHRTFALVVLGLALSLAFRVRAATMDPWLRGPALMLALAVVAQLLLGALAIWTGLKVGITAAHVVGAAMVLGSSLLLTLRLMKLSGRLRSV